MTKRQHLLLKTGTTIILPIVSMLITLSIISALQTPAIQATKVNTPIAKDSPISAPDARIGNAGVPVTLTISKINVSAPIVPVGLTGSGDMESPSTNEDTGWYSYGARPGNKGTSVIAGHLGVNGNAVFSQLRQLIIGDSIEVIDDRQQTMSFKVVEIRTYDNNASASEVFNSASGSHLNLITCEGDWDSAQDTYADRLVVFTTLQDNS